MDRAGAVEAKRSPVDAAGVGYSGPGSGSGSGSGSPMTSGSSAIPQRKHSFPRHGSRGLLSEEIAEQKAHLEQGISASSSPGLQRPPLSPATGLHLRAGGGAGVSGGGGGGGSMMNRSMSEEPLFNDLRVDNNHLDHAPMSAPVTAPAPIYGFGTPTSQQQPITAAGGGGGGGGDDGGGTGGGGGGGGGVSASPPLPFASSVGAASASYGLSASLASPG